MNDTGNICVAVIFVLIFAIWKIFLLSFSSNRLSLILCITEKKNQVCTREKSEYIRWEGEMIRQQKLDGIIIVEMF